MTGLSLTITLQAARPRRLEEGPVRDALAWLWTSARHKGQPALVGLCRDVLQVGNAPVINPRCRGTPFSFRRGLGADPGTCILATFLLARRRDLFLFGVSTR